MQRWLLWLKAPGAVLAAVAITFLPATAKLREGRAAEEQGFLWLGLLVQLAGFYLVWRELRLTLQSEGAPSLWARIAGFWGRRPWNKRSIMATGNAGLSISGSARGRIRSGQGDGSVEARLKALESNLTHFEAEFDGHVKETEQRLRDLKETVTEERRARASDVERLNQKIRDIKIGSADTELIGLLWFVSGCVSSTLAGWLASL